jgi:hypothetical protein
MAFANPVDDDDVAVGIGGAQRREAPVGRRCVPGFRAVAAGKRDDDEVAGPAPLGDRPGAAMDEEAAAERRPYPETEFRDR